MNALTVILIIIAAAVLLIFLICLLIFNQLVWHKTFSVPSFIAKAVAGNDGDNKFEKDVEKAVSHFESMPLEALTLTAENGEAIRAELLIPEKSNGTVIIACHGARSSGIGEFCFMADYFYNNGFTVLMPEHRGCGKSGGKFMGYGTHESDDALLWLRYAESRFPKMNFFLLGVSMGAATVLMMSSKIRTGEVCGIIADCSYTSAWEEFSYHLKNSFHLPDFPLLHICNLYSILFCGYSFRNAAPIEAVKDAKAPVLFIHGRADDYVPFFMQRQLYDACTAEKHLLSVDNAVHARSYYTDKNIYEKAINEFFEKYSHQGVQK